MTVEGANAAFCYRSQTYTPNVDAEGLTTGADRRSFVHQTAVNTLREVRQTDTALALPARKG